MAKAPVQKFHVFTSFTRAAVGDEIAANAVTSACYPTLGFGRMLGGFRSDIASETGSGVRIEQSFDGGTSWDIISSSCLATACAASSFNINIVGDYVRFYWKNGATAASLVRYKFYLLPS